MDIEKIEKEKELLKRLEKYRVKINVLNRMYINSINMNPEKLSQGSVSISIDEDSEFVEQIIVLFKHNIKSMIEKIKREIEEL